MITVGSPIIPEGIFGSEI